MLSMQRSSRVFIWSKSMAPLIQTSFTPCSMALYMNVGPRDGGVNDYGDRGRGRPSAYESDELRAVHARHHPVHHDQVGLVAASSVLWPDCLNILSST